MQNIYDETNQILNEDITIDSILIESEIEYLLNENDEIENLPEKSNDDNSQKQAKKEANLEKRKNMIAKSKKLLNKMKASLDDEDYLVNGFSYHSKLLYKFCIKFPFLGSILGQPLIAITKLATNNAISQKIERDKIMKLYTTYKGNKAAVDQKIIMLEKLNKLTNAQKEELVTLKKMQAEITMDLKKLEYNFKLSHVESGHNIIKK